MHLFWHVVPPVDVQEYSSSRIVSQVPALHLSKRHKHSEPPLTPQSLASQLLQSCLDYYCVFAVP
eukprot:4822361-Amphidinium_carterae.1